MQQHCHSSRVPRQLRSTFLPPSLVGCVQSTIVSDGFFLVVQRSHVTNDALVRDVLIGCAVDDWMFVSSLAVRHKINHT